MKKDKQAQPEEPQSSEYKNMVDLLAVFSEASNRMAELQTQANRDLLEMVDEHKPEYAKLQETLTKTEAAIEAIVFAHLDWFAVRKSITTPYGAVKLTTGTHLEVANEEVSIVLIEREAEKNEEFKLDTYTRQATELNIEALEKLDDATLARFRIKRVKDQNCKVVSAAINMGKAIKEAPAVKEVVPAREAS